MKTIIQEWFDKPNDVHSNETLVLHKHEKEQRKLVVVFVHGLGGDRYETWEADQGGHSFPAYLFDDKKLSDSVDVAMYGYRTLFHRLRFWKSHKVKVEARNLAESIRDELSLYSSVILIGHSMGGLLCKGAIAYLLKSGQEPNTLAALERIDGLILMATPQLGALKLSFLRRQLAKLIPPLCYDEKVLEPHNDYIKDIADTFENHLTFRERYFALARTFIPIWAVRALDDNWVDPLSSEIGLPSGQRKVVPGSHTEIVKPHSRDAPSYVFVKNKIQLLLDPPWVVETEFGATNLSNPSISGTDHQSHYRPGFRIFWPQGDRWFESLEAAVRVNVDFALLYHKPDVGFRPNINIKVMHTGDAAIQDILGMHRKQFEVLKYEILGTFDNEQPDHPADVALITMRHMNPTEALSIPFAAGEILYQIQRLHLWSKTLFTITATRLESQSQEFPGLDEEMRQVLNSLQVD